MNVLLLETIADQAFDILKAAEDIIIFEGYTPETADKILQNTSIDAIITRGIGKITADRIDNCKNLKVIARCGVGLDNVDVIAATAQNIKVINAPGANASTVAEHTIALILMLQRNLYQAINDVKQGNWAARATFKSDELTGKTIGILGLGNIGQKVAKIAEALGMQVVYWSKSPKVTKYQFLPLEELFTKSDVLSLHLPFNPETENLFNKESLKKLKLTAIIVNTARGQLVDKNAILNALNNNELAGYGSDVPTSPPPTASDELSQHPKTLITAHISSLTVTTYNNMCVYTVNNVLAILRNQKPQENAVFNRKELNLN
jgi:D-3-phosphoglycerate dehydrogenase / 2-oxoglutarate reductase